MPVVPIANLPQEYSQLDQPGLYITLANSSVGQQYLLHHSIAQHSGALPILVHTTAINETFQAHDPQRCLQVMHRLPVATTLARLPIDLPRLCRGAQRTIFVSGCAEDINDWSTFLTQHGAALQQFAFQQSYCMHFLLVAAQPYALSQQFLANNQYLSGLAILIYSDLASTYQVLFWKSATRIAGDQEFELNTHVLPWQALTEPLQVPARTGDRHEWLFDAQIFQGSPLTIDPSWQIFDSPEALAQAASTKREATVCFCLKANTNLEELARLIHQVRQAAGVRLKVFVYEKSGLIRHSEARFLWRSGANMVIPSKITVSYLLQVAQQLASVRYEGEWVTNMEDYLTRRRPPEAKGVVALVDFVEAVERTLVQTVASVLVRLPPRAKLSSAQTVANIEVMRAGDVLTLTNHEVYVFLYGCHPQMVEVALNNIFNMPWQSLFRRYEAFTDRKAIQQQLTTLAHVAEQTPLSLIPTVLDAAPSHPKPTVVPAKGAPSQPSKSVHYTPTVHSLTANLDS